MKKKAVGSNLPEYRKELAPELALAPDLEQQYKDVLTQVYPLPAQITVLQQVCDELLNFESKEDPCPFYFRAAAPWVLAQVCNYGEVDVARLAKGHSWFSQHEVAIGFPIEWYKMKEGKRQFHDWAMLYPFIFVDNPYSMSGGRQVYGWSKAGIEIERRLPEFGPNEPRCLVSAARRKYKHVRHGAVQTEPSAFIQSLPDDPGIAQEFFTVMQQRPFLSGRGGLTNTIRSVPGVIGNLFSATSEILDLAGKALSAFQDNTLISLLPFLKRWYSFMARFLPTSLDVLYGGKSDGARSDSPPEINIITRKQFRDCDGRGNACYQAIVASCMKIDQALDGGLLFDPISGDASGGVRITVIGDNDFDLVKKLGIVPAKHTHKEKEKHTEYELRPLVPFWAKLNLSYGAATDQCWRAQDLHWSDSDDPRPYEAVHPGAHPVKYKTVDSGSDEALEPSLRYDPLTARFCLLKARTDKLEPLVQDYLKNPFFQFKLRHDLTDHDSSILWAIAISFCMVDGREHTYFDRALILMLPMWWSEDNWKKEQLAMFPMYSFVGTDWSFLTYNEVFGIFTARATLASPPNLWMEGQETGEGAPKLLEVKSQVLNIRKAAPQAAERTIFTIRERRPDEIGDWQSPPASMDPVHLMQLDDYLNSEHPFYTIILKQIHDAKKGDRACYRSLVGLERRITIGRRDEQKPMPPISIEIGKREGHALVRNLGLITENRNGVETLEPDLCLELPNGSSMIDHSAKNLCWQVGSGEWQRG